VEPSQAWTDAEVSGPRLLGHRSRDQNDVLLGSPEQKEKNHVGFSTWTALDGPNESDRTVVSAESSTGPIGGPLAIASMTLGLLTWPIAFNLGAYGEVLYDDIFRVLVASSILLVITLVNPAYRRPWSWLVSLALAAPLLWFVAAAVIAGSTSEAMEEPVFVVALVIIAVVSVPMTLRLLIHLFTPELTRTGSRRLTLSIVALVVAVGLVGFAFGRNNDRYMTCSDFALAGASEPENCAP